EVRGAENGPVESVEIAIDTATYRVELHKLGAHRDRHLLTGTQLVALVGRRDSADSCLRAAICCYSRVEEVLLTNEAGNVGARRVRVNRVGIRELLNAT